MGKCINWCSMQFTYKHIVTNTIFVWSIWNKTLIDEQCFSLRYLHHLAWWIRTGTHLSPHYFYILSFPMTYLVLSKDWWTSAEYQKPDIFLQLIPYKQEIAVGTRANKTKKSSFNIWCSEGARRSYKCNIFHILFGLVRVTWLVSAPYKDNCTIGFLL